MNITKSRERFMAVGCSHGDLIDPEAAAAVIEFKRRFKPKRVFHLGDWCDTAALRAGSKGSEDEGRPIGSDIECGLKFLEKLGVTDCTAGNHDERPYRFLNSYNSMTAEMAKFIVDGIENKMRKLRINWVNSWDIRSFISAYGYKFMHGYMFGANCARDHAETHGNVIFAHAHVATMAKGRRDDCPTGFCVGTLANIPAMTYAKNRRNTLAWSHGIVYGEGSGDRCDWVQLHEHKPGTPWSLPI